MKINGVQQNNIIKNFNERSIENKKENNSSFFSTLQEKLSEVNEKQITADKTTESFIKGEEEDIHKVMLATQEAKMSLELAVQIRNKLVEAYQEIDRMQI